jgi:hypothetical protein
MPTYANAHFYTAVWPEIVHEGHTLVLEPGESAELPEAVTATGLVEVRRPKKVEKAPEQEKE